MTSNLIALKVENFKNIGLVELEFTHDGVFSIMGPNGAGKSSILDAIEAAIGGKQATKLEQPIKEGEETSRIIATFDDLIVTRTYGPKGTAIDVRNTEGLKYTDPSAVLAKLFSRVAIDPFAFAQLDEKDQVGTLLKLTGYDPTDDYAQEKNLRATRTEQGRERDRLKAIVDSSEGVGSDVPDEESSVAELSAKLQEALTKNAAITAAEAKIKERAAAIDELEERVASLRKMQEQAQAELRELGDVTITDELENKITHAEANNAKVRTKLANAKAAADYAAAESTYIATTEKINAVIKGRAERLATAKLPAGLQIDPETFALKMADGSPFSQANTAAKITAGFNVGLALNPTLKLIAIRDASLLDSVNRKTINDLAKAHQFLVLLETVDESQATGVILSEGAVAEVRV